MRIIEPLIPGCIYHIYNCGNNGESLFKEKRNYYYFLSKYQQYCSLIFETYAYVLMNNHFHLLVRVNEHVMVTGKDGKTEVELIASRQLSHFFNSYAQSINKACDRKGKLFEVPFKRKMVDKENYFIRLVRYIHRNPEYHGFVSDFRQWEFSSWHYLMHDIHSFLAKEQVMAYFESKHQFECFHIGQQKEDEINEMNSDKIIDHNPVGVNNPDRVI